MSALSSPSPTTAGGALAGVLVVGVGNPLRGDDGIGPAVAIALHEELSAAGAVVLELHQLTPEIALDLAAARLLVLVDAAADRPAGEVSVEPLEPDGEDHGGSGLSHGIDVHSLLAMAELLYRARPRAVLVSVGAASFEPGVAFSVPLREALPRACDAVRRVVTEGGGASA